MPETIYALATPLGKSGVAIIRISGSRARSIAIEISGDNLIPRQVHYRSLCDSSGVELDHAVVIYFAAPASFTGEDVVEFQIHGGRAVIEAVLGRIGEFENTRPADPGEFTRRALLNGKLDMLQVEALGDFIDADTEAQRRFAMSGYQGEASHWADELKEKFIYAMSLVTASIDFVDEELPEGIGNQINQAIDDIKSMLEEELQRSDKTKSLKDGYRVAIIGRPNVGKSTLLNALVGRDVAITTDIPGTTRDIIEVFININGLPVIFIDTAGIHETDDHVEAIGIDRAKKAAREADLRVFLYEDKNELNLLPIKPQQDDIVLKSKADLLAVDDKSISAKTGHGIDELLKQVANFFSGYDKELGYFSHQRQIDILDQALEFTEEAKEFAKSDESQYELLAESLRKAVFALDRLIGRVDVEDMLDFIFSKFCIGK